MGVEDIPQMELEPWNALETSQEAGFLELAKEFVALEDAIKDAKDAIETYQARKADIEQVLMNHMLDSGMESMRIGGRTVYQEHKLWAQVDPEAKAIGLVNDALKKTGHGDLLSETYNSNQLSAVIREMEKNGESLPEDWQGLIWGNMVVKLKTRKSK